MYTAEKITKGVINEFFQHILYPKAILFGLTFLGMSPLSKNYVSFLLAMFLLLSGCVHADESVPDKFNISIGAYSVFRTDAAISFTEPSLGAGISVNPEDTLGLDSEQTVLRLTGYYRFTKEHALNYS